MPQHQSFLAEAHEIGASCMALHLSRAARRVSRRFDEALRPAGLTVGQFSLLMGLNRPTPPTMSLLAEELGMDRTTLTASLKPLERRGLVQVRPDPQDRRSRVLHATDAARALLAEAIPLWRRAQAETVAEVSLAKPDLLRRTLRALGSPAARVDA